MQEACLKLHKVGRQFEDRYDKAKVADRELNCEQRIRACCNLFRVSLTKLITPECYANSCTGLEVCLYRGRPGEKRETLG